MQRITPFLWFNAQAEDARDFHLSVFRNSHPGTTTLHCEDGPGQAGSVMTANLELDGQEFVAVNGGSLFRFSPAISIVLNCETQVEVDAYWERLSAGGEQQACGWLKNRFGVSWQIVPRLRIRTLADSDRHRAARVMKAMMQIKKIVIAELEGAWNAR